MKSRVFCKCHTAFTYFDSYLLCVFLCSFVFLFSFILLLFLLFYCFILFCFLFSYVLFLLVLCFTFISTLVLVLGPLCNFCLSYHFCTPYCTPYSVCSVCRGQLYKLLFLKVLYKQSYYCYYYLSDFQEPKTQEKELRIRFNCLCFVSCIC